MWGGSRLFDATVGAGAGGDEGFGLEGAASLESKAEMAMRFEVMAVEEKKIVERGGGGIYIQRPWRDRG